MAADERSSASDWVRIVRLVGAMTESDRLAGVEQLAAIGRLSLARFVLQVVAERDSGPAVRRRAQEAVRAAGGPVSEGVALLGRELAHRSLLDRERAAWACCIVRHPDLAFTIRQRLRAETEPAARVALLHALSALGTASDLMVVLPFFSALEPAVRLAALRVASGLAAQEAGPYIVQAALDSDEEVRALARGILEARGEAETRELLRQMSAASLEWQVQAAASFLECASLPALGTSSPSMDASVLAAPNEGREWALELVEKRQVERWQELTRRLEREKDPGLAGFLIACLGRLGASAAVGSLLPYLGHKDARVRANTVEALRLLARPDQLDLLLPSLEDEDNRVRANALVALAAHPQVDLLARLGAMASSKREPMQLSALYVAEMLGSAQAAAAVAKLADSPFEAIRKAWKERAAAAPAAAEARRLGPRGWAAAALAGLAALGLWLGPGVEESEETRRTARAPSPIVRKRPWMPELPPPRDPALASASLRKAPLVLSPRHVKFLEETRGASTTLESFSDRWRTLHEILSNLADDERSEIATLAEMILLRGSLRQRPQESCARLDEWIAQAARLLLPRLAQEGRRD